jgi:hypothetical protein
MQARTTSTTANDLGIGDFSSSGVTPKFKG